MTDLASQLALFFMLSPVAADQVAVVSDKTERGGPTEAVVVDEDDRTVAVSTGRLRFLGTLGLIEGEQGPVGFALARSPLAGASLDPSLVGVRIRTGPAAADGLVYSIILRMAGAVVPGLPGQLTHQFSFVNRSATDFTARWAQFKPFVRGREVAPGQAPALDVRRVTDWAVQITRSAQTPVNREIDPLPFSIWLER